MPRIPLHAKGRPPKKTDGLPTAQLAKSQGIKIKNPKDYVVIIGDKIVDGRRVITVTPTLPSELPEGFKVRYNPPGGESVIVTIIRDYGDTLDVELPNGQTSIVGRSKLALIFQGPTDARLVHKKDLRKKFGDKIGKLFWDSSTGTRVPFVPPPRKSVPPKKEEPKPEPKPEEVPKG